MRKDPGILQWAMELYQTHRAGPFASSGLVSFGHLPTVDFSKDTQALEHVMKSISESKPVHPLDKARLSFLHTFLENGDEGTGEFLLFPAQSIAAGNDTTSGLDTNFSRATSSLLPLHCLTHSQQALSTCLLTMQQLRPQSTMNTFPATLM